MKDMNMEIPMLRVQYRMHSLICKFVSEHLYDGMLQTDQSVIRCRNIAAKDTWAIWMDICRMVQK